MSFRIETNVELNKYYNEVFRPALLKMIDAKDKTYFINGGKIVCHQENIVEQDGWKLKGLKLTGKKEYTMFVYSDANSFCSDVVETGNSAEEMNEKFLFWKNQLSI